MKRTLLFLFACVVAVYSHSMMICADWDTSSNTCKAPIRDSGQSLREQSYSWSNGNPACQRVFKSPISSYYSNGASCTGGGPCADPMGTLASGSSFNVMYYARNHANANGGTVYLYLSPAITASTSTDPTADTFATNLLCSGPYTNCPNGNGDAVNCYLPCKIPAGVQEGNYTLWWKWDWNGPLYATCADVVVTGANGGGDTGTGSASAMSFSVALIAGLIALLF